MVATICDQGATNCAAINKLVTDARSIYLKNNQEPKRRFLIKELEVIPLFDVPHLVKGIRNNLLKKNLVWEKDVGEKLVAKWEHIKNAYLIDKAEGSLRLIPKITEFHVMPGKLKKMKVAYATQVFSRSMAVAIHDFVRHGM